MPGRLSPALVPARLRGRAGAGALALSLLLAGTSACNSALVHGLATAFEDAPSARVLRYRPEAEGFEGPESALLARFAPAFELGEGEADWNRIGTPALARRAGIERARVDVARPALFAEARAETVGGREVLQLVYRIHFDQFALSAGALASLHRNAGLLVLVTLDREGNVPLFVTTVHTCGCWVAFQPTTLLAPDALPADWPAHELELDGEHLAARLAPPGEGQRFLVRLRTRTHRVQEVTLAPDAAAGEVALPLCAMAELERLPIRGTDGETGSFYYEKGYLRGYVKGAWAPLEGLTLGILTLDPRLGMDRAFGDPAVTGARFFTALAPWKRAATRLDRFERALAAAGFRVAAFAPAGGR